MWYNVPSPQKQPENHQKMLFWICFCQHMGLSLGGSRPAAIPLGFYFMVRKSRLNKSSMWLFDFKTCKNEETCQKRKKRANLKPLNSVVQKARGLQAAWRL